MARPDRYEEQYKRLRNGLGLALAVAWIVWWWFSNSADEQASLSAQAPSDGIISWGLNWWNRGDAAFAFGWKMIFAVATSPLAFVVSHYFARWRVEQLQKSEHARAEAAREGQLAQQAADLDRIRKTAESDGEKAQRANERHELITRIGDVDSQLLVFETEKDQERKTRMLLNLTQFIYEIHAKYPSERLGGVLGADPVIPKMIENTLNHMRALGLQDRNFYAVLSGFLPASETSP
jgi:hypothetical protein